jgi:hypothetical protein
LTRLDEEAMRASGVDSWSSLRLIISPSVLFTGRYLQARYRSYDVGPDGRFLLLVGPREETTTRLEVVTNFFSELGRKAGLGKQ